ncbi:hypothetical protein EFQU50X_00296 [Enterococcus faecium]|nr:hypothetical protein EFQU50X_00296 [Enterococcus faecium]
MESFVSLNLTNNTDKIIEGMDCRELADIYKKFYLKTVSSNRKNPINIVTTNYDMYSERALDELNFIYNNGFTGSYTRTFNPNIYRYMYVDNMNLNKDVWNRVDHFYNFFVCQIKLDKSSFVT